MIATCQFVPTTQFSPITWQLTTWACESFFWDTWSQPIISFQTAAHTASHGSVTHSEVSNIYPPLHIQAHRGSWLYISSKRMQWLHVSWRNHLLDSLLQVGICHAIRYSELVWRKKEVHKMSPDQGQTKWKMCLMLDTSAFLSRFLEWTGCEQAVCVSGCDHRWTVLLFLLLSAQHAGPEIVLHSRQPT